MLIALPLCKSSKDAELTPAYYAYYAVHKAQDQCRRIVSIAHTTGVGLELIRCRVYNASQHDENPKPLHRALAWRRPYSKHSALSAKLTPAFLFSGHLLSCWGLPVPGQPSTPCTQPSRLAITGQVLGAGKYLFTPLLSQRPMQASPTK